MHPPVLGACRELPIRRIHGKGAPADGRAERGIVSPFVLAVAPEARGGGLGALEGARLLRAHAEGLEAAVGAGHAQEGEIGDRLPGEVKDRGGGERGELLRAGRCGVDGWRGREQREAARRERHWRPVRN